MSEPRPDASEPTGAPRAAPPLHSLGGREPPPDLAGDLLRITSLPTSARERLWEVLGPSLSEPIPREAEALLDAFCRAHRVDGDDLARALKAARFLLREAAAIDLPRARFADDLQRLCPDAPGIGALLLAGYERARGHVRAELVREAIAEHGKVLTEVALRVDTIRASERAPRLDATIGVLTLRFADGDDRGKITLQLTPDKALELREACDRLLGEGARSAPPDPARRR